MKTGVLIFSIFLFASQFTNCKADTIILAADLWCPINCDTADAYQGIMVELAEIIFAKAGHTVDYRIMPWSRAIDDARNGKIAGIIGAFMGDAPDFIFPQNELLKISGDSFFVKKGNKWQYKDMSSLSSITLGVIQDYDYGIEMNEHIKNSKNIFVIGGSNPLERLNKMLMTNRIDVIIESPPVFWHTANTMDLKDSVIYAGQISEPEKCFISFSPKIPKSKEYADILSKGILDIKKSGEYQKLFAKYGL